MRGVRVPKTHGSPEVVKVFVAVPFLATVSLMIWNSGVGFAQPRPGILKLSILDAGTGQSTPARVELLDEQGQSYIAEDALPMDGDCNTDREKPAWLTLEQSVALLSKKLSNPYTGTDQFYSVGSSEISLPPGTYQLRVMKGIEYKMQEREVQILPGETTKLAVKIARWINLAGQGWYSADDHVCTSHDLSRNSTLSSRR